MNRLYGRDQLAFRNAVALRLSPDAMRLEACFALEARSTAPEVLLGLIAQQSTALGVQLRLSQRELDSLLHGAAVGRWVTVTEATAPKIPVDGRLELLVPVSVASARHSFPGNRYAVRAGTALARTIPSIPAVPATNLYGQLVMPRAPHEARLPRGANTDLRADDTVLVAACDGEVRLRNLQIEIVPGMLHCGDVANGATIVERGLPVFITGSVLHGAVVDCDDEVYVQGNVVEADIISAKQAITVIGSVTGTSSRPCRLQAAQGITCGPLRHSVISAGADIRILDRVWQCTLRAKGNVILPCTMAESLTDVELHVEGGILPILESDTQLTALQPERRHARVGGRLRASIALHSIADLQFRPCTVLDLSMGGARCALHGKDLDPGLGSVVQLKLTLPDHRDQMFIIGRVSRKIGEGLVGVTFLQTTQRDQNRLTDYCLQLVLKRPNHLLASKDLRGTNVPSTSTSVRTGVAEISLRQPLRTI